jgi:hypothetical protein
MCLPLQACLQLALHQLSVTPPAAGTKDSSCVHLLPLYLCLQCLQALLHQLPLLLSNIASVWLELEASGADDPSTERGELLYGGSMWSSSSSSSSSWEDGGCDDASLGQSLAASEEASGEAERRQAVRPRTVLSLGLLCVVLNCLMSLSLAPQKGEITFVPSKVWLCVKCVAGGKAWSCR